MGQNKTRGVLYGYRFDDTKQIRKQRCDPEDLENYVVQFIESKVFGSLIATLSKGNNVFPIQHDQQTELYVFTARAVDKLLLGDEVKTGPIIVPPRPGPPRFPLLKQESTSQQR